MTLQFWTHPPHTSSASTVVCTCRLNCLGASPLHGATATLLSCVEDRSVRPYEVREKHYVGNTCVISIRYIQCGKIGYLSYNFALLNYIKKQEILQKLGIWTSWYAIYGTKRVILTLPLFNWNANGRTSSHNMQEERNFDSYRLGIARSAQIMLLGIGVRLPGRTDVSLLRSVLTGSGANPAP